VDRRAFPEMTERPSSRWVFVASVRKLVDMLLAG